MYPHKAEGRHTPFDSSTVALKSSARAFVVSPGAFALNLLNRSIAFSVRSSGVRSSTKVRYNLMDWSSNLGLRHAGHVFMRESHSIQ